MPDHYWRVEIAFTEDADRTRAHAILELTDHGYHGLGQAERALQDRGVPVVGQELAAARAMAALSHELLRAAADRIESYEHHPVKLHA